MFSIFPDLFNGYFLNVCCTICSTVLPIAFTTLNTCLFHEAIYSHSFLIFLSYYSQISSSPFKHNNTEDMIEVDISCEPPIYQVMNFTAMVTCEQLQVARAEVSCSKPCSRHESGVWVLAPVSDSSLEAPHALH